MRIESKTVLLVFLCVWIPAAQLQYATSPPEDEDASGGDEEMSGSGSGDGDSITPTDFSLSLESTHAGTNMTETTWVTDVPVTVPEQTVYQLPSTVIPSADVETAGPTSTATLLPTTSKIPETQPSPTTNTFIFEVKEVPGFEVTTVHEDQVETTTNEDIKVEDLPVVPVTTKQSVTTTPEHVLEETAVPVLEKEEEEVLGQFDPIIETSDVETTLLTLTTLAANEVPDPDTSDDIVVSTTVQTTVEDYINANKIPEGESDPDRTEPLDGDFIFENEIKRIDSEVGLGASADDGSLLERKEVLAGVIAGGLVGLAFAIMLVALMVYRMKKKDEGSYSLDEQKHPNGGYQKPTSQEEFLA